RLQSDRNLRLSTKDLGRTRIGLALQLDMQGGLGQPNFDQYHFCGKSHRTFLFRSQLLLGLVDVNEGLRCARWVGGARALARECGNPGAWRNHWLHSHLVVRTRQLSRPSQWPESRVSQSLSSE